jgi:phage shock protein C
MEKGSKKLYRSRYDRIVFGVCGGIGDYFETDAFLIRLIFFFLTLINGIGLAIYIFLTILLPREPIHGSHQKEQHGGIRERITENVQATARSIKNDDPENATKRNIIAFVIVLIGLFALTMPAPFSFGWQWIRWDITSAVIMILSGIYFVFRYNRN